MTQPDCPLGEIQPIPVSHVAGGGAASDMRGDQRTWPPDHRDSGAQNECIAALSAGSVSGAVLALSDDYAVQAWLGGRLFLSQPVLLSTCPLHCHAQGFEAFRKEHAAVLEARSLAAEDVLAKARIMALLVLGARREEISFATIQARFLADAVLSCTCLLLLQAFLGNSDHATSSFPCRPSQRNHLVRGLLCISFCMIAVHASAFRLFSTHL